MDSMNLQNFKNDPSKVQETADTDNSNLGNDNTRIAGTGYQEELHTLKIDKLSNKITIISIIIPIMILGILVFAYLDMKERVVDVDQTKQSQVEKISIQMEEQLNSLELKIAKNRFDLDNTVPEIKKQNVSLTGQVAKLGSSKLDNKTFKSNINKLSTRINNNAKQDKAILQTIERINQDTIATIESSQTQFDESSKKIKDEFNLFKEEFDARLLELSDYELQIGMLKKNLSLLDKRIKSMEHDYLTEINSLKNIIKKQKLDFDKQLQQVKSTSKKSASKPAKTSTKKTTKNKAAQVSPQITIDPSRPNTIQEKPLTR